MLKMAKFGHVGSLGGPGVEEGVRTGLTDNGVTLGLPRRAALAGSAWPSTGRRWRKREARRREAAAVGPICKASRARLLRHKGATSSSSDLITFNISCVRGTSTDRSYAGCDIWRSNSRVVAEKGRVSQKPCDNLVGSGERRHINTCCR